MKIRIERVSVGPPEVSRMPFGGLGSELGHEIATGPSKVTMEVYIDKSDANYMEEINKIMRQGFGHLVAEEPSKSKVVIKDGGIEAYDETGMMRVKIGDLGSAIPPEIKFKSDGLKKELRDFTAFPTLDKLADDIKDAYSKVTTETLLGDQMPGEKLPPWYEFKGEDYDAYGNLIGEQKKTHKQKGADKPSVQLEESW